MKRTVRPSRFQLGDASEEPRPSYRKLCFVNPFQLEAPNALPFASSVPVSICNSSQHKPFVAARPPIVPCAGTVESSARSLEEAARLKWAQAWVACARVVAAHSASLCDISSDSAFLPLFLDRSPSTLQRHLSGWQVWTSYCVLQGWTAAAPSMAQVLDFLESLRAGCTRDRGKERKRSAAAVLRAMFFAAFKLSLPVLSSLLESPLIQAWKDLGKWNMAAVREAIPLPLDLVRKLERAFLEVEGESRVILGAILLMIWGSLRWSEIQRLDLKSVQLCDGMIKGRCWRTKSSVRGMPWACLSSGCCGSDWGSVLMETIADIRSSNPLQDFLVSAKGHPMPYAAMLGHLRCFLSSVSSLQQEFVRQYTLHSLKATLLTWALQCHAPVAERAAQGHHKIPGASGCVQKYGRDDIFPQISCQKRILRAVQSGWEPGVPLQRGLMTALNPPAADDVDDDVTECSSDDESCSAQIDDTISCSSLADSDGDSVEDFCDDTIADAAVVEDAGPWVLNMWSGIAHKACRFSDGEVGVHLACRPGAILHAGYEERWVNPTLEGFRACQHRACRQSSCTS